jgi:hypothetical protein
MTAILKQAKRIPMNLDPFSRSKDAIIPQIANPPRNE